MLRSILPLLSCLAGIAAIITAPALAQEPPKARVQLEVARSADTDSGKRWALLHFTIADEWHIYWQNPGDSGIAPTVEWELPEGVDAGPIHWPAPHRIAYSGLYNYGYSHDVTLPVPLTISSNASGTLALQATVRWLVCKDICIPEMQEVSLGDMSDDTPKAQQQLIQALAQVPVPADLNAHYDQEAGETHLWFSLPKAISDSTQVTSVWWYPVDDGIISNGGDQRWSIENKIVHIHTEAGSAEAIDLLRGHVVIERTSADALHVLVSATHEGTAAASVAEPSAKQTALPDASSPAAAGLMAALIAAFIGGLILNVMPCVLPILSLKALSIASTAHHSPQRVRSDGLAYAAGVLVCFLGVAALMIGLQQAGSAIGWGFQLQSPHFVVAMCYVIFLVALNLSGAYTLPSILGTLSHRLGAQGGLSGAFFTGALAALVATPCSAPFMATGIGYALGQPPAVALLIFAALGAGMAFPYTAICFVPCLRRLLPKPGAWMERLRQLLAFPMYATCAWLLWVLVQQSGPGGLANAFFGLCMIGFAAWMVPLLANNRLVRATLLIALLGLLVRTIEQQELAQGFVPVQQSERVDYFSSEKLRRLLDEGKPVFVDVTAAWCITCKINERVAINTDQVQQVMRERGIITLVADWTNRDDAITRYLASFGRNGVPLYVYYAPHQDPVILPQVLTPELVLNYLHSTPTP